MPTILRIGSSGSEVRELQRLLNSQLQPSPNLRANGRFRARTRRAVRSFQQNKWLVVDGVVGRCTWAALRGQERYVESNLFSPRKSMQLTHSLPGMTLPSMLRSPANYL